MTQSEQIDCRIHHTMLPVADLERSIAFYIGALGMTVMGRRVQEARQVEVAHVGYGDRATQPSIELTMGIGRNATAAVRPTGTHVAIHVSDLRRLCATLEQAGVRFLQPLVEPAAGGRSPRAWISDPDGHEIELAESHRS
jgi:lactoylglutathione lyase